MRITLFAMAAAMPVMMGGCAQPNSSSTAQAVTMPGTAATSAPVDGQLCQVKAWQYDDVAAACKVGQKVLFLPESFGNEQLPVVFAAVNCDLRYSVALTTGAVTCIYRPIVPRVSPPSASGKS